MLIMTTSLFAENTLIPIPKVYEVGGTGEFVINSATRIDLSQAPQSGGVANYLQEKLAPAMGFTLQIATTGAIRSNAIALQIVDAMELEGDEAYSIRSSKEKVVISAKTSHGLFNGVTTLLQLLPAEIASDSVQKADWKIASVYIEDYPEYEWRGLMLDVSRHFFTKEEVMDYIDVMALYKYNVFHWHLTDDQGWRIEIKQYPELTQKGAWRVPREGDWWSFDPPKPGEEATYGGFYTQEEIKEVIAYAAERFITVLPEIDVPGHSLALISCFPDMTCKTPKARNLEVNPGSKFWGKVPNTLCLGNEAVYEMFDNIFDEVIELFPSEYIHVGGDEAWKGFWRTCRRCRKNRRENGIVGVDKHQSYFIQRMEDIVRAKGREIIGWDEILEGGLADNAAVMSWRGTEGGIAAAKAKHKVVMSPSPYCYLDLYQGNTDYEPITYNMARLTDSYHYNPMPEGIDPQYILGIQGNLWSEEVSEMRHAQYMTWPRSFAIAEGGWAKDEQKDWANFQPRVEEHFKRFDLAKIKYAKSVYDPQYEIKKEGGRKYIKFFGEFANINFHYSFQGAEPDSFYPVGNDWVQIPLGASYVKVAGFRDEEQMGRMMKFDL